MVKSIVRRAGVAAINQRDHSEYSPLMYAAEYDRPDVARFLLACGAEKNAKNKLSHSALELADWYGNFSVLKVVDVEAWAVATKALEAQKKKQAKAAEAKAASEAEAAAAAAELSAAPVTQASTTAAAASSSSSSSSAIAAAATAAGTD